MFSLGEFFWPGLFSPASFFRVSSEADKETFFGGRGGGEELRGGHFGGLNGEPRYPESREDFPDEEQLEETDEEDDTEDVLESGIGVEEKDAKGLGGLPPGWGSSWSVSVSVLD